MVLRLRPLDVTLTFEDRMYKLGETISCQVELVAKADVDVREARIDLVCQVHWAESYTVMVPAVRGHPVVGQWSDRPAVFMCLPMFQKWYPRTTKRATSTAASCSFRTPNSNRPAGTNITPGWRSNQRPRIMRIRVP